MKTTETRQDTRGPDRDSLFRFWLNSFMGVGGTPDDPSVQITLISPSLTGLFMWASAMALLVGLWGLVLFMAVMAAAR